ncbi:MAG: hypothetical protein AABW99_01635 [archaeon]
MKIPPMEECEALMAEFEVPEHIRKHTEEVRKVSNFLAKKISSNGKKIDLGLVDRASLMHDFLKMHCIKNNCRHALEAGKVMAGRGYAEFGEVLKLHGLEEVNNFDSKTCLEAKIVWYADKRVNHGGIVSLKARYDYLKQRYGSMGEQKLREILSTEKSAFGVEKEILGLAKVKSDFGGLK